MKPDNIGAAPEKGRLDRPSMSDRIDQQGDLEPPKKPAPKKLAPFNPDEDHVAQFQGGNPLSPTGSDDFGTGAVKLLSDDELDQVIAMREQDVNDKVGLSPSQDLKILQAEKAKRGKGTPVGAKPPAMSKFDPDADHVAQFQGGNPLSPTGTDDFGRSAAKLLSDDELDQAIALRTRDVTDKKGLSPQQDLKVLQAERDSRGGPKPRLAPSSQACRSRPTSVATSSLAASRQRGHLRHRKPGNAASPLRK